jgi:H+/Cl- antiporter ClcA
MFILRCSHAEESTMKLHIEDFPKVVQPVLRYFHVDFDPRRPPSGAEVALASLVAVVGSLVVDMALVAVGTRLFPSVRNYGHFHFSDYAKLTVVGVVIACVAWPIVVRISSKPRWLFFRMAIVVTIVLLAPDVYIWHQGQPAKGVVVLMCMHLAIALVTYNALVRIAPTHRHRRRTPAHQA